MALGKRLINTGAVAAAACSTDSVQAFGANNAFSSNIALYQLDSDGGTTNNVPDTTTNYNGTASNVTYATGQFGNSAVFNGNNSYIDTGATLLGQTYTVSLWFNANTITSSSDGDVLYAQYNSGDAGRHIVSIYNGNLRIFVGGQTVQTISTTWSTSTWTHLVVIKDSSGYEAFVNGSSIGTSSLTASIDVTENTMIGGDDGLASYSFDGSLDQVRIFDKAISAEDVATLYAETSSTASNTNPFSEGAGVALYTMDYDASEASGYYDGESTNVDFGVGGKTNYGARFNGSSSYINLGTGSSGLSGLLNQKVSQSVSFWMNTSYTGISGNSIIYSVYAGAGISLNVYYLTNGKLYFLTRYSNNSTTFTTTQTFNDSQWHHVAVTIDVPNLERKIYIDNSLVSTQSLSSASYGGSGTTGVALGTNGNFNTQYYKGDLDQVRIFSKALNQTEVNTLYNSGDGETACVYDSTTDDNYFPLADGSSDAVAYYKLDNSTEDSVGTNDGTDTNIEYRFGRFGQAAVFNNNSAITTSFNIGRTNDFTISFWIKDITDSNYGSYADKWVMGVYNGDYIPITYNKTSSKVSYTIHNGTTLLGTLQTPALDDNWHHIVFTQDINVETKLYVDGVLQTSETVSHTSMTQRRAVSGGTGFYFGQNPSNSSTDLRLKGSVDQVRIYSSALTSSQVADLYNEKPEVDTSNFKTVLYEGNGSTNYISNVGFDLDVDNGGDGGLVWIKSRTAAYYHRAFDSVRGLSTDGVLYPNTTADADNLPTANDNFTSFDANGFTLGATSSTDNGSNKDNVDFVAWVWKGGGDAVSNTNGTGITSSVSASDKGFSIVNWSATTTTTHTVGHGLNIDGVATKPELMIMKNASSSSTNWFVYTDIIDGSMDFFYLNDDAAKANSSLSVPNTTTFQQGNLGGVSTGNNCIAYCFHSVEGYSKIGSYNGGTYGIQLPTGFKASWIMIKKYSSGTERIWYIYDTKRGGDLENALFPNLPNAEATGTNFIDFNDTNVEINATGDGVNGSGSSYIYMAFK